MPLGQIMTSPLPDLLGRTHQDAQVSSPDSSPIIDSSSFDPAPTLAERPVRKSSLINPNSLVSKHISTFSAESSSPTGTGNTTSAVPRPLAFNRNSRTVNPAGAGTSRNFTSPLPFSSRSPSTALASTPSVADLSQDQSVSDAASTASLTPSQSAASVATPRISPRNPRFDLYRPAGSPMNRSPSSMNLPRDVSRKTPSPLPLSANRKSSVDSTSTLPTPSPSLSSFGPQPTPEPAESVNIPALIAAAGSSEAAISKLLVEKQTASSHNSQLWRLVEKQRAMILGLNKDLERALKDKEKYRQKLKNHLVSSATFSTLPDTDAKAGNLDDIDEDESDGPVDRTRAGGPAPLSKSTSIPMYNTPMRPPFQTPISNGGSAAKSPAPPDQGIDSLPSDYSIFSEQKALASRKDPPAPLTFFHAPVIPPATSSEYASEASLYTPLEQAPASSGTPAEDASSHQSDQLNATAQGSPQHRTLSLGSGTASPDAGSPNVAQVETYRSMNSVNAVLLDAGTVQTQLDRVSLLPLQKNSLNSDLSRPAKPRPLNLSSKSSPNTPTSASLFPRSPQAQALARLSPTVSQPTTASSPLLSQPSVRTLRSQHSSISDRIASAPTFTDAPTVTRDRDGIFRGYMSEAFPGMLLPPSALTFVHIKVDSARLRPSRINASKSEDQNVLSLAVRSRPDDVLLWRVEKSAAALMYLDQQLRSLNVRLRFKMPDRSLFTGHAPARIDARRAALITYFGQFLDYMLEDSAASVLATFLSTDALGDGDEKSPTICAPLGPNDLNPPSRPLLRRCGYLTKKGKNFGGWKARYFVLEGSLLNYYESPGGTHLGTIKLAMARIGRQTPPNAMDEEEVDNQYRHAFMILEPKRQDPANSLRHILCAETDDERDAWVFTLQYSELKQGDDKEIIVDPVEEDESEAPEILPQLQRSEQSEVFQPSQRAAPSAPVLKKTPKLQKSMVDVQRPGSKDPMHSKSSTALRAVGYTDVIAAEAPIIGPSISNANDPVHSNSVSSSVTETESDGVPSTHPSISGPSNGTVIHETESWGNKQPAAKEKDKDRKRSIFAFRGRSTTDNAPSSVPERSRVVFGAPLTEACELSRSFESSLYLPAVLYRSFEFLRARDALSEEGIFRMSGSSVAIKSLRERFDSEGDVNLLAPEENHEINTVASLLKLYLRELPANILTREANGDFLKALDLEEEQQPEALNGLINRLPRANREVLSQLSAFLKEIVDNEPVNKMSVRNVGIVFAPTLNIPAPLISLFVTDHPVIFGTPLQADLSFLSAPPTPTANLSIFPSDTSEPRGPRKTGATPGSGQQSGSMASLANGASMSTYAQQAMAAKEAFDTGYKTNGLDSQASSNTLVSARQALQSGQSSSSMRAALGLDRSKTDSPLSSHRHRMSSHADSTNILNVSISQSPLLGASELRREKSVSTPSHSEKQQREGDSNNSSPSMVSLLKSKRKSGQFLVQAGFMDDSFGHGRDDGTSGLANGLFTPGGGSPGSSKRDGNVSSDKKLRSRSSRNFSRS